MNTEKVVQFLSVWVVNSLLFVILSQVLAANIILGNDRVVAPMAMVFGGLVLTLFVYAVEPVLKKAGYRGKDKKLMLLFYLAANVVGVWIVKRLERITGVGISNTVYVVLFAVVATFAQWAVMTYVTPMLLKQGKRK